jgi:WD40-like Beta Propeller Repeat
VSSKGTSDGIWKLTNGEATELWSAVDAGLIGGPEVAPDGRRIAFSVERRGARLLYVMNADGTNVRVVTDSLELRGSPPWTPDGESITSAATVEGTPRLLRISTGGAAVPLVQEYSVDPVWSPGGDFLVYSGADIGTTWNWKGRQLRVGPADPTSIEGLPIGIPPTSDGQQFGRHHSGLSAGRRCPPRTFDDYWSPVPRSPELLLTIESVLRRYGSACKSDV